MKKLLHSILFLMMVGLIVWQLTGCKRTPAPPTEQDAIAVWKNVNSPPPHLADLVSLTKTNGQMETVNGLRIYTLYYQAKVKTTVQLGNRPPGTIDIQNSNYPFQWTEKGWLGPDNQVYPER